MLMIRKTRTGIALACAALAAICLSGCTSGTAATNDGAPPPPEVGVASALNRPVRAWDEFNGRVSAVDSVSLLPRVSGYIERVAYKEGDEVKKGDLLFSIDERPYRAALNDAQARLERARTAEDMARTQANRADKLIAANAISREEFESLGSDLARSSADVRAAEAAVTAARLNLAFTEVRSPIAGRAGRAMLSAGNLAKADESVLTTVVSQNQMHVYFDCDERNYLRYQELAQKKGPKHERLVRVGLADEAGYPHTGRVDFLDNHVNPQTGTIRARALLANPARKLTPGMHARVQFNGDGEFDALLINDRAVLTDQGRKYVYVVGPENKAMRKDVVVGRLVDGAGAAAGQPLRVVESGLAGTDKVIVSGTQKVFYPGMPVNPVPVTMEAPEATAAKSAKAAG